MLRIRVTHVFERRVYVIIAALAIALLWTVLYRPQPPTGRVVEFKRDYRGRVA